MKLPLLQLISIIYMSVYKELSQEQDLCETHWLFWVLLTLKGFVFYNNVEGWVCGGGRIVDSARTM